MSFSVFILLFLMGIQKSVGPPVTKQKAPDAPVPENENDREPIEQYMEYHRYLKEVVSALESDPEFRKKLEQADEADIRSGKIADQLEFVSHHVRTKLDEIKRTEIERLRSLVEKKEELMNGNSIEDPTHGHLDHSNPHTFEIEDLKKLIKKTSEDLAEADRRRREEFKRYEMQKEIEKMEKLNETTGEEREKLERQFKELEEKHKKHEPLHEPGHKAQLEEVWEKQDHMEQEFDPKAFFMMHDLDSNGFWDENEVKALFVKELDKMYAAGAPEDDMRERIEEMERMRETVFRDVDKNQDGFIDFNEFIAQTKNPEFQEDHGWQALDEAKPYTDEELQEYLRQYQMQHHPQYQVHYPNQVPPQGYQGYPNNPPGYANHVPQQGYHNQVPPQGYPNQGYPNQAYPQGYPNQAPPQGYPNQGVPQGYSNQVPPQGQYHQAPPQGQYNQAPPQGQYNQAPPQGQYNQASPQGQANQVPPQGQANQVPPQGQANQIPQGQANQVPPLGQANQVPPQGQANQVPPQGQANQVPPQGQANQVPPQQYPNQNDHNQIPSQNDLNQASSNQAPAQVNQAPNPVPPQVNQPPQQAPQVHQNAPQAQTDKRSSGEKRQ